jgi:hypothetical protein
MASNEWSFGSKKTPPAGASESEKSLNLGAPI